MQRIAGILLVTSATLSAWSPIAGAASKEESCRRSSFLVYDGCYGLSFNLTPEVKVCKGDTIFDAKRFNGLEYDAFEDQTFRTGRLTFIPAKRAACDPSKPDECFEGIYIEIFEQGSEKPFGKIKQEIGKRFGSCKF